MNTPKILIVDDDPNILLSLDYLMRKNGFHVFVARNGAEALELIETEIPELVLLDIMMPDVDGYEICKEVQSKEWSKHIKIIFLSAKSKDADIQKGIELGAVAYITKPFSSKQLLAEVQQHLSK
jgi:DNA-binding response OmpR family regulator